MSGLKYVIGGLVAAGMAVALIGDVTAQAQGADLVKQRIKEMGQMAKAFGPLIQIVKGENENFDAAVASAEIMNANAKKIVVKINAF